MNEDFDGAIAYLEDVIRELSFKSIKGKQFVTTSCHGGLTISHRQTRPENRLRIRKRAQEEEKEDEDIPIVSAFNAKRSIPFINVRNISPQTTQNERRL